MTSRIDLNRLSVLPRFEKAIFKDINISSLNLSINKTQEKLLMMLSDNIENNMSELSKMLGLEKGSFTSTVDSLIKKNLVERKNSETDRRKIELKLTEAGKEMSKKIKNLIDEMIEEKFGCLEEEEVQEFNSALNTILKYTNKIIEK